LSLGSCHEHFAPEPGGGSPVPGNQAPVIAYLEAQPDTIAVGQEARLVYAVEDPDGDALTLRWSALRGTIVPTGDGYLYSAAACCAGDDVVFLRVDDGRGGTASGETGVFVAP